MSESCLSKEHDKGGRHGLFWMLALILIGAGYYGLYFRCGFNLADEGSVMLLSQRILQGERPLTDLMLGYNILWFYPISGLFWLFGVSLVAMRIYFFSLALITALLGYSIVCRITGHRLYAFIVGLLLVAYPGTSYRVYLPFLVMVNGYCLLRLIRDNGWLWVTAGATVLGLTFLVRVDVGIFFALIWIGTLVLNAFAPRHPDRKRAALLPSIVLTAIVVLAVHLPVYFLAKAQGFNREFLQQYVTSYRLMRDGIIRGNLMPAKAAKAPVARLVNINANKPDVAAPAQEAEAGRMNLARKPFAQIWKAKKWKARAQAFVTYAPIFSLGALLTWTLSIGIRRRLEPDIYPRLLTILVLSGGALTLFPQFFGFRPDVSHLAEFMPGFIVAAAAGGFYLFQNIRAKKYVGPPCAMLVCILLVLHLAVWIVFAFPQRGAGTIALRSGRTEPFHAENGVNILLTSEEAAGYGEIRDLVIKNAQPEEYVVCYPYSPGINILANRPTYEWSLYVDNAVRAPNFDAKTIAKLKSKKPAVIVINDWAINQSKDSRFSVWAGKTQQYIEENYTLAGTILKYQIYALKE
ncbi:MAG: hypothetical protein JWL59_4177 [Chthoniobacteraceae bacterium]|nr:hypothetical protein [Chthoniobacteraceae bacterium]